MISVLYAYDHWLNVMRKSRVYGNGGPDFVSPIASARAISAVYFPELDENLADLERVGRNYEIWMLEAGKKRLAGNTAELNLGFDDAYKPYWAEFMKLLTALKKVARSEMAG